MGEEEQAPLFETEQAPAVKELVAEVSRFCARTGVKRWPLKSESIAQWCEGIISDPRYATIDLPYQVRICGEHWEPIAGKKKAAPHRRIRNWLNKAVEIAASDGRGVSSEPSDEELRQRAIQEAASRRRARRSA